MTTIASPTRRRAFTMLEMIVAIAVFVIIVSAVVPRIGNNDRRRGTLAVDKIADLLTMFAQRESLTGATIAISYDPERREVAMLIAATDITTADGVLDWGYDRFVDPVIIPDNTELLAPTVDGETLSDEAWLIETRPGESRPDIVMALDILGTVVTVHLPSHAVAPTRSDAWSEASEIREPVDLDATGRYREDW